MRKLLCGIVAGLTLASSLVATEASAAETQFTFFDQSTTHTATKSAAVTKAGPTNWVSPTNFASGRLYLRFAVTSRPSTKPLDVQLCAWRNNWAEETCSKTQRFGAVGTYWFDLGSPASWWKLNGTWSWATDFDQVRLMVKDPDTGKLLMTGSCGSACSPPEAVNGHVPLTFYATAIVVAQGATLTPPASWQGCPAAWSPQCPNPSSPPPSDWAYPTHGYRLPITANVGTTARTDRVVSAQVDFGAALGGAGALDPSTLRTDPDVPVQFNPASGDPDSGELLLMLPGSTTGSRDVDVYFDTVGSGAPSSVVTPVVSVTEGTVDEGQESIVFNTLTGKLRLHRQGGGLSSLEDSSGSDWLSYSTAAGSAGAYRGLPNAVHPQGHFHPGSTTADTELLTSGPVRATAVSTTSDGLWQMRYDVNPTTVTVTMTRAAGSYWLLYEGTPGGQIDPTSDVVIRPNGKRTALSTSWKGDLAGDEWVAFADTVRRRSLFLAHHQRDTHADSHFLMQGNMTVFGFGRSGLSKYLTGSHSMTFGLIGADTTAAAKAASLAALRSITVTVGSLEVRPAGA